MPKSRRMAFGISNVEIVRNVNTVRRCAQHTYTRKRMINNFDWFAGSLSMNIAFDPTLSDSAPASY